MSDRASPSARVRAEIVGLVLAAVALALTFSVRSVPAGLSVLVCMMILARRFIGLREPLSTLGWATAITWVRGLAVASLAGLAWLDADLWLLFALYASVLLLDAVDGFVARALGQESELGARLDVEVDALGLVVAPLVAVIEGRLPAYYLVLSAAYYVFRLALRVRRRLGRPVYEDRLRPSRNSRVFAGFQMGLVCVAFVPLAPQWMLDLSTPLFMAPVLVGFARDWNFATGRWDPGTPEYVAAADHWIGLVRLSFPILLRAGLAVFAIYAAPVSSDGAQWSEWAVMLGTGAVVLGILPRTGCLVLLAGISTLPMAPLSIAWTGVAVIVLLLGAGRWVAGPTEERWLYEKPGRADEGLRAPVRRALTWLAALGLVAYVFRDIETEAWSLALSNVRAMDLAVLLGLNALALALWSERGYRLLRRTGPAPNRRVFFLTRIASFSASYVTPGPQFGGEPVQLVLLRRHGVSGPRAAAAIAVDRVVEVVANSVVLGLLLAVGARTLTGAPWSGAMLAPLLLFALAVAWLAALRAGRRPTMGLAARLPGLGRLAEAEGHAVQLVRESRGSLLEAMLVSGLSWAVNVTEMWWTWKIVAAPMDTAQIMTAIAAARLAFLTPLPGGVGALEASQVFAVEAIGVPVSFAIAYCAVSRGRDLVQVLLGFWAIRYSYGSEETGTPSSKSTAT